MRNRRLAAGLIAAMVVVTGGCGAQPSSTATPAPPEAGLRANQRVLDQLPVVAGARLVNSADIEGPRGGHGAMSHRWYLTPGLDRDSVVAVFKDRLREWRVVDEVTLPARHTVTFVRGAAYVVVSATELDSGASPSDVQRSPGYALAVNALDAALLKPGV